MVVEQLIFTFVSFAIFVYMFFRMIKSNDTSYVVILVLEVLGIALNFVEVLFGIKLNALFIIIKYLLAMLLPIGIIILEKRNSPIFEMINITKAKSMIAIETITISNTLLLVGFPIINVFSSIDRYPPNLPEFKCFYIAV